MIQYSPYDSPMSPYSFLSVIFRRRKVILILLFAIITIVIGVSFILPPVYESSAKVMIQHDGDIEKNILLGLNSRIGDAQYDLIDTEQSIIATRQIIEPVVLELGLDQIKRKNLDVNDKEMLREQAIAQLRKKIKVKRERDTNLLIVSYENKNPHIAKKVVELVVEQYKKQRPSIELVENKVEQFETQINDIKKQIAELEENTLPIKSKVLVPDKQSQILFASLADFDKELTRVRTERIAHEARLKVIREQRAKGDNISIPNTDASASLSKMDYLNELRRTLLGLDLKRSSMSKKYTSKHPDMIVVMQDIESTKSKIKEEIDKIIEAEETNVKTLISSEFQLSAQMAHVADAIAELSRQTTILDHMTIGIDELKEVCSLLIKQREEAKISRTRKENFVFVRILEQAVLPYAPVRPNKPLFASVAILFGIVISLGVAFFIEYFDHAVTTVEDVHHCLGLPTLATITDVEVQRLGPVIENNHNPSLSEAKKINPENLNLN